MSEGELETHLRINFDSRSNKMYYQRNRSKTVLLVLAALLLSAALSATASAQTNVAFSDGTFVVSSGQPPSPGWTYVVAAAAAGDAYTPTLTLTQKLTGGNPGDWMSEYFTMKGTNTAVIFWVFNPANTFTGTFASLNYSYDLQDQGHSAFIGHNMAVEQNGQVYITGNPTVEDGLIVAHTAWADEPNPFFHTGLVASQFCAVPPNASDSVPLDCNSNPDFSTPTTTVFGYSVGASFQGGSPHGPPGVFETGIDNWCVVLVGASGPGGSGPGCQGVSNLGTANTTSVN
jgi:hypothetical protein